MAVALKLLLAAALLLAQGGALAEKATTTDVDAAGTTDADTSTGADTTAGSTTEDTSAARARSGASLAFASVGFVLLTSGNGAMAESATTTAIDEAGASEADSTTGEGATSSRVVRAGPGVS